MTKNQKIEFMKQKVEEIIKQSKLDYLNNLNNVPKTQIVNQIIEELEKVMKNEN